MIQGFQGQIETNSEKNLFFLTKFWILHSYCFTNSPVSKEIVNMLTYKKSNRNQLIELVIFNKKYG